MRYLFYYYNNEGTLIFDYRDDYGRRFHRCYLYYTLREAVKKFRQDFDLRYKHITVQRLY
ncbi:MAG: hypothetical protein NC183_06910 [Corallococcus sp.]|nr:hypothetical protein [Corallococcus sp.]